jgi:hypothetical protein
LSLRAARHHSAERIGFFAVEVFDVRDADQK